MIAVILAGGVGKRLWPVGRRNKPKQFHSFFGEHTLLQETYLRLKHSGFKDSDIFVSTGKNFVKLIKAQVPRAIWKNILVEPKSFDTAFGMGFAASELSKMGRGEEPCVFVPADHFISDYPAFKSALAAMEMLINKARASNKEILVDMAVVPILPSTALGYTKIGKLVKKINGIEVRKFLGHKEKPDEKTARKYIASGKFLWHANYYCSTPVFFLKLLKKYSPKITKPISFDYAVAEKIDPKLVLIIKAPFSWSDIGTWDEVWAKTKQKDKVGNVIKGAVVLKDMHDSLVFGYGKKVIVAAGLSDVCIIDTPDALLVMDKNMAQHSKKIIEMLEGLDKRAVL